MSVFSITGHSTPIQRFIFPFLIVLDFTDLHEKIYNYNVDPVRYEDGSGNKDFRPELFTF